MSFGSRWSTKPYGRCQKAAASLCQNWQKFVPSIANGFSGNYVQKGQMPSKPGLQSETAAERKTLLRASSSCWLRLQQWFFRPVILLRMWPRGEEEQQKRVQKRLEEEKKDKDKAGLGDKVSK